jgi:hypothetical protein
MRTPLLFGLLLLTGCVSSPFSVSPSPDHPMVLLTISARSGYPSVPQYDGIWSIDGRDIPKGPVQSIHIAPGEHEISYLCPGWISMDGFPSLPYVFAAGAHYEINCEKNPHIELVSGGA